MSFERATLLFEQGRLDLAEQEVRQALSQAPDDARAHALLSLCLAGGERFAEATEEAQRAIGLAPYLPNGHYALARVMLRRGRLDEAETAATDAIDVDPDNPHLFALLAGIHMERRNWREALVAAEDGLKLDPEDDECTNLRTQALVQLNRKALAADAIYEALARDPENPYTHANQGWAYLHQAKYGAAQEHFLEALRLYPGHGWARAGLVESLKARNPIYGLMLRYFLFMSRMNRQRQWLIILGAFLAARVLSMLEDAIPAVRPLATLLLLLYAAFAILTWVTYPFFNLTLRLHPVGRHALSPDQRRGANWLGACLLLALLSVAAGLASGQDGPWILALLAAALCLPIAGTFQCQPGWPRRTMAAFTLGLAATGAFGILLGTALRYTTLPLTNQASGDNLIAVALIGSILSTWVSTLLAQARPLK